LATHEQKPTVFCPCLTAYFCLFCGASQSRFGFKELYILFYAILLLWFAAFFNHHISAGSVTWSPMMQKLAFFGAWFYCKLYFHFL
jgi:hypothetical protein